MKKIYFLAVILLALSSCQQPQKEKDTKVEVKAQKNVVVENIMNRRSIRSYLPEQISDAQLDTIIQCAINAPSALNRQSWEVRVIQNPELLKEMNDGFIHYSKNLKLQGSASKSQEVGFSVFHGAPALIIIAHQKDNFYSAVDCGLLGENILLAAESMDIGTCVIGSIKGFLDTPEARKTILPKFNLPEGYEVLYTISMGYKNERPDAKPRDKGKVQVIK